MDNCTKKNIVDLEYLKSCLDTGEYGKIETHLINNSLTEYIQKEFLVSIISAGDKKALALTKKHDFPIDTNVTLLFGILCENHDDISLYETFLRSLTGPIKEHGSMLDVIYLNESFINRNDHVHLIEQIVKKCSKPHEAANDAFLQAGWSGLDNVFKFIATNFKECLSADTLLRNSP